MWLVSKKQRVRDKPCDSSVRPPCVHCRIDLVKLLEASGEGAHTDLQSNFQSLPKRRLPLSSVSSQLQLLLDTEKDVGSTCYDKSFGVERQDWGRVAGPVPLDLDPSTEAPPQYTKVCPTTRLPVVPSFTLCLKIAATWTICVGKHRMIWEAEVPASGFRHISISGTCQHH